VNNNENDILMLEQSTAISQNVAKLFHLKDIPNVKTSTRHKKITEIIQLSIYLIVTFTLVKCLLNIIGSNYAMKTATLYIFIASIMYLYIKNIYIKDILGKFATPQKIVLNEVIDIASKIEELEEAGMKIAYKQDQAYIYDTDRYGKIIVELRDDSTVIIARDDIISTVARLVARKTVRPNPFAFLQKRIMKKMQYKQKEDSNTEKNENNSENNKSDK
jgi:urease gamma subunit